MNECLDCKLNKYLCICDNFSKFNIDTFISVIMPKSEWNKSSNSGSLVAATLKNSKIYIKGEKNVNLDFNKIIKKNYENLVLFPGGYELDNDFLKQVNKKINLIVPDGTWRSAPRVIKREKELFMLPRVSFKSPEKSNYKLRTSPSIDRISTFEAIILALDIIEQNEKLKKNLEKSFLMKVERMLWLRGKKKLSDLTYQVPKKAISWKNGLLSS